MFILTLFVNLQIRLYSYLTKHWYVNLRRNLIFVKSRLSFLHTSKQSSIPLRVANALDFSWSYDNTFNPYHCSKANNNYSLHCDKTLNTLHSLYSRISINISLIISHYLLSSIWSILNACLFGNTIFSVFLVIVAILSILQTSGNILVFTVWILLQLSTFLRESLLFYIKSISWYYLSLLYRVISNSSCNLFQLILFIFSEWILIQLRIIWNKIFRSSFFRS